MPVKRTTKNISVSVGSKTKKPVKRKPVKRKPATKKPATKKPATKKPVKRKVLMSSAKLQQKAAVYLLASANASAKGR